MTADPPESGSLRTILHEFREAIMAAADTRESVSVEVVRRDGFQNEGVTPRGLSVLVDEPVSFGGRGEAVDPAELLLAAAGASLSVTLTAHAALRGLMLDAVRASLSAKIDGRAFFLPGEGEAGLLDVRVDLHVRAPVSQNEMEALLTDVLLAVPVLRTFARAPAVVLHFEDSR